MPDKKKIKKPVRPADPSKFMFRSVDDGVVAPYSYENVGRGLDWVRKEHPKLASGISPILRRALDERDASITKQPNTQRELYASSIDPTTKKPIYSERTAKKAAKPGNVNFGAKLPARFTQDNVIVQEPKDILNNVMSGVRTSIENTPTKALNAGVIMTRGAVKGITAKETKAIQDEKRLKDLKEASIKAVPFASNLVNSTRRPAIAKPAETITIPSMTRKRFNAQPIMDAYSDASAAIDRDGGGGAARAMKANIYARTINAVGAASNQFEMQQDARADATEGQAQRAQIYNSQINEQSSSAIADATNARTTQQSANFANAADKTMLMYNNEQDRINELEKAKILSLNGKYKNYQGAVEDAAAAGVDTEGMAMEGRMRRMRKFAMGGGFADPPTKREVSREQATQLSTTGGYKPIPGMTNTFVRTQTTPGAMNTNTARPPAARPSVRAGTRSVVGAKMIRPPRQVSDTIYFNEPVLPKAPVAQTAPYAAARPVDIHADTNVQGTVKYGVPGAPDTLLLRPGYTDSQVQTASAIWQDGQRYRTNQKPVIGLSGNSKPFPYRNPMKPRMAMGGSMGQPKVFR